MRQIRVYVEEETYERLKKLSEKVGKTVGQVAGNIIDETRATHEVLENITEVLKIHSESQERLEEKIDRLLAYSHVMILNLTAIVKAANIEMTIEEKKELREMVKKAVQNTLEILKKEGA